METYIITFEDGEHYLTYKISAGDEKAVRDGIITIIRCSDYKELLRTGEWQELRKWDD